MTQLLPTETGMLRAVVHDQCTLSGVVKKKRGPPRQNILNTPTTRAHTHVPFLNTVSGLLLRAGLPYKNELQVYHVAARLRAARFVRGSLISSQS